MTKSILEVIGFKETETSTVRPEHEKALDASFGKSMLVFSRDQSFPYYSTDTSQLPTNVEQSQWQTLSDPERLARQFEFNDVKAMLYFLDELMVEQERINHHARIAIDHRTILVETYTRDVNAVTEIDKALASFCDELYEDVRQIGLED